MGKQQLAVAVRRRRRQLGLSELAVAERAGIARLTVRRIEAGEPVRDSSVDNLDEALEWPAGRTAKLLGSDPVRASPTPPVRDMTDRQLAVHLQHATDEVARRLNRPSAPT